jgi:hypothetical protein
MTMDITIDSLANLMIKQYGEDASFTAAERSRVLRDCNDGQSSRTWLLISRRIDLIAPPQPKADTSLWPAKIGLAPPTSGGETPNSDLSEELVEDAELVT